MTLSLSVLESELSTIIDETDPNYQGLYTGTDVAASRLTAAARWATAYDNYVNNGSAFGTSQAVDISTDSVSSTDKAGFQSALPFSSTTSAEMAAEFGAAFVAFWTGGVFAIGLLAGSPGVPCAHTFVPPGNGIWALEASSVVIAAVSGPIITALTTYFNTDRTQSQAVTEFAAILHAATIADVTVLITGTDTQTIPGPQPISNTCQVQ